MKRTRIPVSFPDDDPRSSNYKRELVIPQMRWGQLAARIFLPALSGCVLFALLRRVTGAETALWTVVICAAVYASVHLKRIILSSVKIYQRFAPRKLRSRCRFEPSCSQYMILATERYGAVMGLRKGIGRLCRCNDRGDGLRGGLDPP